MKTQTKLKNKVLSHIIVRGQKETSEKILKKSLKTLQKVQNQSHSDLIKLAIINSTPMFRVIKLKNNRRRKKKSVKEIPAFLSTYMFRASWSLKYLTQTLNKKESKTFSKGFNDEILLNAKQLGKAVKFKNELQDQALKKKKYFRNYRW